jgi:hypothetical protein
VSLEGDIETPGPYLFMFHQEMSSFAPIYSLSGHIALHRPQNSKSKWLSIDTFETTSQKPLFPLIKLIISGILSE